MVLGGFGWFQVVSGGFGWFRVASGGLLFEKNLGALWLISWIMKFIRVAHSNVFYVGLAANSC